MHFNIQNGEPSDLVIEYCGISGMNCEVDGRGGKKIRRKPGECDDVESKEKGSQC